MRVRLWVTLLASITALAIVAGACAPSKPNNSAGPTPTPTTPTPTPPVSPTPLPPGPPFTPIESWINNGGQEFWVRGTLGGAGTLLNYQYSGPGTCNEVQDLALTGTNGQTVTILGFVTSGGTPKLACAVGATHLDFDYTDEAGVLQHYFVDTTSTATFYPGDAVLSGIIGTTAKNTGAQRFYTDASAAVTIESARIYSPTNVIIDECTIGAVMDPNALTTTATGYNIFDISGCKRGGGLPLGVLPNGTGTFHAFFRGTYDDGSEFQQLLPYTNVADEDTIPVHP